MKIKQIQNNSKEFIFMMATLISIVALSIDAMLPALNIIKTDLHVLNANYIQYIVSIFFAGLAIGQLFYGSFSDAYGRKPVLFIGLIIYIIGSLICLFSYNLPLMLMGRFIQGLGAAGPYISVTSIVRDQYSGRRMAKIMSLIMMIFVMIPAIAPALGQLLLFIGSWHLLFILYISYAIIIFLLVFSKLTETLVKEKRIPFNFKNIIQGIKTVLSHRSSVLYFIANGCISGVLIGDLSTISQIFKGLYNIQNMFALFFAAQALAFGISSLINSKFVERLGMQYICLRSCLLIVCASFLLILIEIFFYTPFYLYFIYGLILLFSVGMIFGNLNALAMKPMGNIAGLASSIIGASSNIIGMSCGIIIGQFYNDTILPVVIGFMIISLISYFLIILANKFNLKHSK